MYGYINPHQPELRVRELDYYRSIYCGLCRTMGKCTGQCSRLTLSYDFTYFAMVRMALEGQCPTITPQKCFLHPFKKKPMAHRCEILEMCAYVSAIMVYHKLQDDRQDERGGKKLLAGLSRPYAKILRKKALKAGYAPVDGQVAKAMKELALLEAQKPMSADQPAEIFGELMAYVLAYGLEGNTQKIAQNVGRHMGRWVYLVDAIDDFEEDKKRGRYNPYLCLWQQGEMTDHRKKTLEQALMAELVATEAALDLCNAPTEESKTLWGVVRNVLYLGMPTTARQILFPECHGKKSHRKHKKTPSHTKKGINP